MNDVIQLTKFAAAQRQIDAAIEMYFSNVDQLAILTTVGAATKLLSEVAKIRGSDILLGHFQKGLVIAIHEYLNGTTPPIDLAEMVAQHLESLDHLSISKIKNLDPGTITAAEAATLLPLSVESRKYLWKEYLHPFNFLKHAKQDLAETISEADLSVSGAIFVAIIHYLKLGLEGTPSMQVFMIYHKSGSLIPNNANSMVQKISAILSQLNEMQAKVACIELISALKAK